MLTRINRILLPAVIQGEKHLGFDRVEPAEQVTLRLAGLLGVELLELDSFLLKLYILLHRPAAALPRLSLQVDVIR